MDASRRGRSRHHSQTRTIITSPFPSVSRCAGAWPSSRSLCQRRTNPTCVLSCAFNIDSQLQPVTPDITPTWLRSQPTQTTTSQAMKHKRNTKRSPKNKQSCDKPRPNHNHTKRNTKQILHQTVTLTAPSSASTTLTNTSLLTAQTVTAESR